MNINYSNHNERINLFKNIGDKFRYMSGREPSSSRSTSGLYFKRSRSYRNRFKFGDTKTMGLIAVIVVIVGIVLRFLYGKIKEWQLIAKCTKRTGDLIGCIESKPYNCKKLKKRIYGYCEDNQKFLLGTKRGPMKKSEKCVKWIWDPKNCPLDYKKKGDEYKKVKKEKKSKKGSKDKASSLLPIAGKPKEMRDETEEDMIDDNIIIDPCVDKNFCGNLNGKEIPCPPKLCLDGCKCD